MRKTRKFDIGGSTSFSPEQEKWLGKADRTDPYILARMRRAVPDRQAPAPVEDRVAKPVPDDIYGKAAPESKSDGSFDALEKKRFTPSESKSDGSFDALEAKRLSSPAPTKVPREEMGDANVAQRANDSPSSAPPAATDKGARDTQRLAKAPAAKPAAKAPAAKAPAVEPKTQRARLDVPNAAGPTPAANPMSKDPSQRPMLTSEERRAKEKMDKKQSRAEQNAQIIAREGAKAKAKAAAAKEKETITPRRSGMSGVTKIDPEDFKKQPKGMGTLTFAKGGSVSSRADGIAQRGKTRCKVC